MGVGVSFEVPVITFPRYQFFKAVDYILGNRRVGMFINGNSCGGMGYEKITASLADFFCLNNFFTWGVISINCERVVVLTVRVWSIVVLLSS